MHSSHCQVKVTARGLCLDTVYGPVQMNWPSDDLLTREDLRRILDLAPDQTISIPGNRWMSPCVIISGTHCILQYTFADVVGDGKKSASVWRLELSREHGMEVFAETFKMWEEAKEDEDEEEASSFFWGERARTDVHVP